MWLCIRSDDEDRETKNNNNNSSKRETFEFEMNVPYLGISSDKHYVCMDEIEHGIWRRRDVLMNTDTLNHKTHLPLFFHCLLVLLLLAQSQWCAVAAKKTTTTNKNNMKRKKNYNKCLQINMHQRNELCIIQSFTSIFVHYLVAVVFYFFVRDT